jgi:hypothetical protein
MHPLSVTHRRIFNAPPDYADNDTSYLLLSSTYRYLSQHSSSFSQSGGLYGRCINKETAGGANPTNGAKIARFAISKHISLHQHICKCRDRDYTKGWTTVDGIGHFDDRSGNKTLFHVSSFSPDVGVYNRRSFFALRKGLGNILAPIGTLPLHHRTVMLLTNNA